MWSTKSELEFLKDIGQYGEKSTGRKRSRKKCLTGYIRGCESRADWTGIDKDAVLAFAKELLKHS